MMTISDNILRSREKRSHLIIEMQNEYKTVISIKVNFPGKNKNHYLAFLIFNSFNLNQLQVKIEKKRGFDSSDGPYYILCSNEEASLVKNKAIDFEEKHALGRFLDIDVYHNKHSLSRTKKRLCYLCGELAHKCVRSKKHKYEDLLDYIEAKTMDYYTNFLSQSINQAMLRELDLDPKFGLVTKKTSGSHDDMDYDLMIKAKNAIIPFFIEMFKASLTLNKLTSDDIKNLIILGQKTEKAMYQATGGVNAYKGLIFHLGLLVISLAYCLSRPCKNDYISIIKEIATIFFTIQKPIKELVDKDSSREQELLGARGEALSGYQHVQNVLRDFEKFESLLDILIYYIIHIEDTNLLKRSGTYDIYIKTKELFNNLSTNDVLAVNDLSEKCIKKRLTFGGSADLLIVTIFIKNLMDNHEKINL